MRVEDDVGMPRIRVFLDEEFAGVFILEGSVAVELDGLIPLIPIESGRLNPLTPPY